jgi:hypothetical protein
MGMNTLQRALIEKAGHEYGFENVLPGSAHWVVLGSARHRAQLSITLANQQWDVFNGFLLSANLDALFDRGLISFDEQGKLIVSSRLNAGQRASIGLNGTQRLRWLSIEHLPYLRFHLTLFLV